MKVAVWVRHEWSRGGACDIKVVSNKEYQEIRQANIEEMFHNDDDFYEWLRDSFSIDELWNMSYERKKEIVEEWKECCAGNFDSYSDWNSYEIEI